MGFLGLLPSEFCECCLLVLDQSGSHVKDVFAQSWSCCFSLQGGDVQPSVGTVLAELFQGEQLSSVPAWPCSGPCWAQSLQQEQSCAAGSAVLPEGAAVPAVPEGVCLWGDQ